MKDGWFNRDEIIWAAGLFEGEGCITEGHARTKDGFKPTYLRLSLGTTDHDVIERFHAAVGHIGSIHIIRHTRMRKNGEPPKPAWGWVTEGFENGQAIIAMLWNWLGTRRRGRAIEIFAKASKNPRAKHKHRCPVDGCVRVTSGELCRKHRNEQWHRDHPKEVLEYRRKWREQNRERIRADAKRYREENPEKVKAALHTAYLKRKEREQQQ